MVAFRLKIEAPIGDGDDTALNSVTFLCNGGKTISGAAGEWGDLYSSDKCPEGFDVAKLTIELEQGPDVNKTASCVLYQLNQAFFCLTVG